jgi:hypothetical protein
MIARLIVYLFTVLLVVNAPLVGYGRAALANPMSQVISREEAISIAKKDARRAYRDLSPYNVEAMRENDGWHVDFVLKNDRTEGGGAHYIIDARDGHIIKKRYDQ